MPFNTLSVASAVTPSVIETYFSHYLNRGPLRQKPTAHISYHEGLRLIRQFLDYSSRHTVEDLQAFTAQWVPAPTWVRIQDSEIAPQFLERSARVIRAQLGRRGLDKIGGATWWQWRRPEAPLRAEWIEMKKDFQERKRTGSKCERVILYVHGGAYYFGSVDEHRYQMQRHARKLKARVLAPRYRLAPQFPFPCGLYDCIATYFYLLEHFEPNQILFAGDSAGGGMVLSMLVILRDQGCPLPAGTILLSPWVDLSHSFPSVAGDGVGDYIPPHGFLHKPSMAWPPPPNDESKRETRKTFEQPPADAVELPAPETKRRKRREGEEGEKEDGSEEEEPRPVSKVQRPPTSSQVPGLGENLRITIDGQSIEIKDQIQLYAPNELLSHPLVSPVMQSSLGGLPPMLIQVGGAELLHDEQVYLAHKAANPKAYPPSDAVLDEYDPRREDLNKYPPTDVQLQVWEDLCHVPHTLSFTRPAKYMYRSVAQFGAWALAHAQHTSIDIQEDDAVSFISSGPEDGEDPSASTTDLSRKRTKTRTNASLESKEKSKSSDHSGPLGSVGRAGDPLPPFKDHMVRQRVTRHGVIYPLAVPSEIACLHLDPASIGAIKAGPVRKWLAARRVNEHKFGNDKKKVQKKRAKEMGLGYDKISGESPPPTALVGRRRNGLAAEEKKKSKSWGLAMWSGWGSSHDESTLEKEEKLEKSINTQPSGVTDNKADAKSDGTNPSNLDVPGQAESVRKKRRTSSVSMLSAPWAAKEKERPQSPYRQVKDTGQVGTPDDASQWTGSSVRIPYSRRSSATASTFASRPVSMAVPTTAVISPDSEKIPGSQNTFLDPSSSRPHNGVMAYPFRLRTPASNPSIATLESQAISASSHDRTEEGGNGGAVELPTPADQAVEADSGIPAAMTARSRSATPSSTTAPDARIGTPQQRENEPSPAGTPKAAASPGTREPVFSHRTSVLGAIGADGMPTAPLRPQPQGQAGDEVPVNGSTRSPSGSTPVSPVDGAQTAPFKIRNPVFDARMAALKENQPQPSDIASPISPIATKPNESTQPTKAPFKLRHVVMDPSAITSPVKAAEPTSAPAAVPVEMPTNDHSAAPALNAQQIAEQAMTPIQPPTGNLPPNTNVVMPTVVARRPMAVQRHTPPPPPPKDERRQVTPKPSTEFKRGGGMDMPKSKFSSTPLIGDLSFEKSEESRPGLESFVTASDGTELKGDKTY